MYPPYWLLSVPSSVARRRAVSVIFLTVTSCNFTPFYFFASTKHCFFEMCLVRSTVAKLCPNIKFDALDFSEYRCEEVIGFFWRSVYFPLTPALVYSGLVLDGSTQSNKSWWYVSKVTTLKVMTKYGRGCEYKLWQTLQKSTLQT